MASLSEAYDLQEIELAAGYKFLFTSTGNRQIIKVVQYTYIQQFEDRSLYSLVFGDYDLKLDKITSDARSDNGDAYKIFRTVLSTIPVFLNHLPDAIIAVHGSDSNTEFAEKCRKTCIRKCSDICCKINQSISVLRNLVEKNAFELGKNYWFLGGFLKDDRIQRIELYVAGRTYDAILFFKK